jgi:hypothetical protein
LKGQKESGKPDKKQKKSKKKSQKDQAQSSSAPKADSNSSSSKGNSQKKDRPTCSYCKKVGHEEHSCHKKQIDELKHLLKKNNINFPSSQQSSTPFSKSSKGKATALVATADSSQQWILDLGASHHMGSVREQFSLLEPCSVPHILIGDDSPVDVIGKGFVDVGTGTFEDVLCVPNLSANLLSIYQISQNGRKVEFTPDSVTIRDLEDNALLAVGKDDHESRLYAFSHFVLDSHSTTFLTHSDSVSKLWHEWFGHLNFAIFSSSTRRIWSQVFLGSVSQMEFVWVVPWESILRTSLTKGRLGGLQKSLSWFTVMWWVHFHPCLSTRLATCSLLLMTFLDTPGSTFFDRKEKLLIDSRSSRLMPRNNLGSASKFFA